MKGKSKILTAITVLTILSKKTVSSDQVEQKYEYSSFWSFNSSSDSSKLALHRTTIWEQVDNKVILYTLPENQERFVVHASNHEIFSIYFEESTSHHKNLLKGIASLFLYRTETWKGWQRDVSGDCFVEYSTKGDNSVVKEKKECISGETMKHKLYDDRGLYTWSSTAVIDMKKDKSLVKAKINEKLVKKDPIAGEYILESQQNIKLLEENIMEDPVVPKDKISTVEEAIESLNSAYKTNFIAEDISTQPKKNKNFKATDIAPLKSKLRENKLATPEGAKAFLTTVKLLKNADEKAIVSLLKDKSNKNILPQLMDALGSAHTIDAFNAVLSVFKPDNINSKFLERFIWALSSVENFWTPSNQHNEVIASKLFEHLKNSKFTSEALRESFIISLSLISNNLKRNEEYLNWFMESLTKCKNDECALKYLRALRNIDFTLLDKFRQDVLKLSKNMLTSENSSKRLKMEAIRISRGIVPELNEGIKNILLTLFMNTEEDNTVRIMAFETLVESNFDVHLVKEILQNLSNNTELTSYVVNKLKSYPKTRLIIYDLIYSGLWNWDLLSINGQSLSYFDRSNYFSTDFGIEVTPSKILKNSHLHINLPNVTNFLKMELSTGGLSGFIADKPDPNDDPNAHLSVELSLLSVPLRPFHLFNSMTELTSLYWSGSLETKQSLLAFNRFIYDSVSIYVFSSGLRLESLLKGAVSMDISGSIVVSLFSQTADSSISSGFGGYVQRSFVGIWKGKEIFSNIHEGQGKFVLDLEGDIRFDGKSCVQLLIQPVSMKETSKTMSISENHKPITIEDTKSINIPGQTLSLHQKISQLCNEVS